MTEYSSLLTPLGLADAVVAHQREYTVRANWKILWENHTECLHCAANHPEYVSGNFDQYDQFSAPTRISVEMAESAERANSTLFPLTRSDLGFPPFPDHADGRWFGAERTALRKGWVTESLNGLQLAPLMGVYTEPISSVVRARSLPNFWMHASCDHAVTTTLRPIDVATTNVRVSWLVSHRARVGLDYSLDHLLSLWLQTSEQDWKICERVQMGVRSPAYKQGPISTEREYNVIRLLDWYIHTLAAHVK